jgi:D-alanyl-D-alanine carboxypeptidase (penicillin-binding protein 5/6)
MIKPLLTFLLPLLLLPLTLHAGPPRRHMPSKMMQAVDPEADQQAPDTKALPAAIPLKPLAPVVHSHFAILVDAVTGKVVWQRNADAPRPIASTTKMLTAILLLERGHLDDIVTAPPGIQLLPDSSLHLKPGEKITLRDLLYAMLLRSANDTAVAGAVYLSGSVPKFAQLMNEKAKEIGATHSHFVTPNGLPAPGHYSTAADLAKIASYAINNLPQFNAIVKTPAYKVRRSIDTRDVWVKNTATTYLKKFPGADGVKTGYIHAAGHCFVGSATRGGWRLVAVALNSGSCREDVESLLNYGFADFEPTVVLHPNDAVGTIDIPSAAQPVKLKVSEKVFFVVSRGKPLPEYQVKLTPVPLLPQAPIAAGTRLGKVTILVNGKPQATGDAVAAEDVAVKPVIALVQKTKKWGQAAGKFIGALAAAALTIGGGWIFYARATAKSARRRRDRFPANVRGVDHTGQGPR